MKSAQRALGFLGPGTDHRRFFSCPRDRRGHGRKVAARARIGWRSLPESMRIDRRWYAKGQIHPHLVAVLPTFCGEPRLCRKCELGEPANTASTPPSQNLIT